MARPIHGGDIYRHQHVIDFSSNCNPWGTPPGVVAAISEAAQGANAYPDVECAALRQAIAEKEAVKPAQVICGNGAADLVFSLVQAVKPQAALLPAPTFSEYGQALATVGCKIREYALSEAEDFQLDEGFVAAITDEVDMVVLCNPNNPTGQVTENDLLMRIIEKCAAVSAVLLLDECFVDFLAEPRAHTMKGLLAENPHVFILKAFTKLYAMAGVRLGYGLCADSALLEKMRDVTQPWNVSGLAQAAGIAALQEEEYVRRTLADLRREREYLLAGISEAGYRIYGSAANYIFFRGEADLYARCLAEGILIRDCSNYSGLTKGYYRVAVKRHGDNEKLLQVLRALHGGEKGEGQEWQRQS